MTEPAFALSTAPAAPPRLRATVVLPCYNEQDHVLAEIERITAALDASEYAGDYARMKDAVNATAESLAAALAQVQQSAVGVTGAAAG